jgi:hypothetical protein
MPPLIAAFAAANATAAATASAAAPAAAATAVAAAPTVVAAAASAAANATAAIAANATAAAAANATGAAVKAATKIAIGWQGGVVIATLAIALIIMGMDLVGPDLVFGTLAAIYMVSGIITLKEGASGFANTVGSGSCGSPCWAADGDDAFGANAVAQAPQARTPWPLALRMGRACTTDRTLNPNAPRARPATPRWRLAGRPDRARAVRRSRRRITNRG